MTEDEEAERTPVPPLLAGITMRRAIILLLAVQLGGWLVFDGMRAFLLGDYVTVGGKLGPWADLLAAIGVEARSGGAKALHVISGLVWLSAVLLDLRGGDRRRLFVFCLPFGLWYLPFGTGIAVACALMALTGETEPPAQAGGSS